MRAPPTARRIATHPFPSRLEPEAAAFARAHPGLRVLVPNAAAGRDFRRATGASFRARTLSQEARLTLDGAGLRPCDTSERLERVLDALDRAELEYLRPIAGRPSTARCVAGLVVELARAAVRPPAFLAAAAEPRERDVARAYALYLARLASERLYDPAMAELAALDRAVADRPLLAHGFAYLDAAQVAFLDRLAPAGASLVTLPFEAGGTAFGEARRTLAALSGRGWQDQALMASASGRAGETASAAIGSPGAPAGSLTLTAFEHEEAEVRGALSRARGLLEAGVPAREIAIVARDERAYLPALEAVAHEYGLPLTSGRTMPLLQTGPGRVLRLLLEANLAGFPYGLVQRLFSSPLLDEVVDVGAATWSLGRTARPGLEPWLAFARPGRRASLERLRLPAEGSAPELSSAVMTALQGLGLTERARGVARHSVALNGIIRTLDALARPPAADREAPRVELAAFASRLELALESHGVPFLLGRAGIRVHSPLAVLGRSFEHVIVVGLNEGAFPALASEHPLLDTHARLALAGRGLSLPTPANRAGVERALFQAALSSARTAVWLSYPQRDAAGKPRLPSPFLAGLRPGSTPERRLVSERERRLEQAVRGRLDASDDAVTAGAIRAAEIERRREGPGPADSFDGRLSRGLPGWLERPWSASQLHDLGACRFRWFARKPLRLEPLPEPAREIEAMAVGSLYHAALEQAAHLADAAGHPMTSEAVERFLDAGFRLAEDKMRASGGLEGALDWRRERNDHLKVLRRAVASPDFGRPGRQLQATEAAFEAATTALEYDDGRSLSLSGYIDRIDLGPAGLEVIDYKLGQYISQVRGSPEPGAALELEIQLAVYLLAGARGALAGGHPVAGARYFSIRKAKTLRETGPAVDAAGWTQHAEDVRGFIRHAMDDIASGNLAALPDAAGKACGYCNYAAVCRHGPRYTTKLAARTVPS